MKIQVRDEEGHRRFHGAFTGGFSAGYYNTVGSKEGVLHWDLETWNYGWIFMALNFRELIESFPGWTPQTFTSSRKNRAEFKQQSIYQFLDDDEIKVLK